MVVGIWINHTFLQTTHINWIQLDKFCFHNHRNVESYQLAGSDQVVTRHLFLVEKMNLSYTMVNAAEEKKGALMTV